MNCKKECFVIMPFSSTNSCTEDKWSEIFTMMIKPSIESFRINMSCKRSIATTGNIVNNIINDIFMADIVIADLTDQNPNVMYELGIRHALAKKTIIIAQNRSYIPSDLQIYANHVYDWKTQSNRLKFKESIHSLLDDIFKYPERKDNPVFDFLGDKNQNSIRAFSNISKSPQFSELLCDAKNELFTIGPKLLYAAQNCKEIIKTRLKSGLSIKFLIMEYRKDAVDLLANYASTDMFGEELKLCKNMFLDWGHEIQFNKNNFQVRETPILPMSLNIVDGQSEEGRMLIIPLPFSTSGASRPCYLLHRKDNSDIFNLYYERFSSLWEISNKIS